MASINKVILIGNLGKDPEIRRLTSGDMVANVSIATSDRYKDKQSGEIKENTEWHRIVFFGKIAEIVEKYLKKGSKIYIEGKIKTRKWTDQAGQEKSITEIIAENMQMLGGSTRFNDTTSISKNTEETKSFSSRLQDITDDDIPF